MSKPTGLVLSPADVLPFPWVETVDCHSPMSNSAIGANTASFIRLKRLPVAFAFTSLEWEVGSAAGNVEAGLYSSDGITLTKIVTTGAVAAAGASARQSSAAAGTIPRYTGALDYYLALWSSDGSASFARVAGTLSAILTEGNMVGTKASLASGLPDTQALSGLSASSNTFWVRAI